MDDGVVLWFMTRRLRMRTNAERSARAAALPASLVARRSSLVAMGCGASTRLNRGVDAVERARAEALAEALRPRPGELPGRLMRRLIHNEGFGSVDGKLERRTAAEALGVVNDASRTFANFYALCDEFGRGTVRLSDFLRALAETGAGERWTPARLDDAMRRRLVGVRWGDLDVSEARVVFMCLVMRFDVDAGDIDVSFDEFRSALERTRGDADATDARELFDEIVSVSAVAGQILEILNNPNIDTFSDETRWLGPFEPRVLSRRVADEYADRASSMSEFARDAEVMTAAVRACRLNRPRDVVYLVEERGLDVDARDDTNGQTLLAIAAANGNKSVCKKLLILGANPSAVDRSGRTAVDAACKYNHFVLAEYLRAHGVPSGDEIRRAGPPSPDETPNGTRGYAYENGSTGDAPSENITSMKSMSSSYNEPDELTSPSAPPLPIEEDARRGEESDLLTPD